ncbi:MAG: DUF1841 family protein [Planctomycetes bacterium]|nr:DUF1841 family protein [Planctomycetota bacterium]
MTFPKDPQNQDALRSLTRDMITHLWGRVERGEPLEGDEAIVGRVLRDHPEYANFWTDTDGAVAARFGPSETNPFLHVHLHVVVENQLRLREPAEAAFFCEHRSAVGDEPHEIRHRLMGALAEAIQEMTRSGEPFDLAGYRRRLRKL